MSIDKDLKSPSAVNKFDKIKEAYEKTISDKMGELTQSIRLVQERPDHDNLTNLQHIVHKLGGSAGSYGYSTVSVLCKKMDSEIGRRAVAGNFEDQAWLTSLNDFLFNVQQEFHFFSIPDSKVVDSSFKTLGRPLLYVVDEDIKFLDLLVRIKDQFSISIETECDPSIALDRLMSPDFNPNIVIVSQIFRTSQLTGFDLIAKMRSKAASSFIFFGLFLDEDTIENRMAATDLDVHYIFRKPVSAYVLLKSMQDILKINQGHPLKVLVVDDDIDFCNYVSVVLTEVAMEVRSIQDCNALFKTLEEYHPSVLLLDLIFPKFEGLNILKILRSDVAYRNLIVIVVTSSEEETIRLDAYAENADDILYKPIDKEILQKRIINLTKRQGAIIELPGSERYTGLGNFAVLKETIRKGLITSKSLEQYLVLFEIDHVAQLEKKEGEIVRNLLVSMSNQLQWEADNHMKCFSYQALFAVVFDSHTMQVVEKKIHDFLFEMIQNETRLHPVFNCSIVPISLTVGNADQILQAAERGLREASVKESAPIRCVKVLFKDELINKKEIVIVDSDPELLNILRNAFESQGLLVNTYKEGGEVLNVLQTYTENRLPSLIIAERKLPDMDGIELYIKLKERFRKEIPFYVLTIFSSDKDVSEGIKQGVLEYIVKPFNISLLVQKSLKTVLKN